MSVSIQTIAPHQLRRKEKKAPGRTAVSRSARFRASWNCPRTNLSGQRCQILDIPGLLPTVLTRSTTRNSGSKTNSNPRPGVASGHLLRPELRTGHRLLLRIQLRLGRVRHSGRDQQRHYRDDVDRMPNSWMPVCHTRPRGGRGADRPPEHPCHDSPPSTRTRGAAGTARTQCQTARAPHHST